MSERASESLVVGSHVARETTSKSTAGRARTLSDAVVIQLSRLVLLAMFLALWQWAPRIPGLTAFHFVDPFYISSPDRVAQRVWELGLGGHGRPTIWSPLITTLVATLIGTLAGTLVGMVGGLLLAESSYLERVLRPFIVAVNAVPRIAMIPIIVIIVGPTPTASATTAFFIVVFLVFYNAFEGGRSVPREVLQNVRILGATRGSIILRVRLQYVLAWTFAVLPNAISFGLIGAVSAEILTGAKGVGQILAAAVYTIDATLTFAVVVILSAVGASLVGLTTLARTRVLHWWEQGDGSAL